MKPSMSRSRKTLHLPLHRHCSAVSSTVTQIDNAAAPTPAEVLTSARGDRDGKSGRVIEVRYRCGRAIDPIVVSTAIDMRKRFFSSVSTHALN